MRKQIWLGAAPKTDITIRDIIRSTGCAFG